MEKFPETKISSIAIEKNLINDFSEPNDAPM